MKWNSGAIMPAQSKVCILVVNDLMLSDMFVWHEKDQVFYGPQIAVKPSEVQAWMCRGEIPFPDWLKDQMDVRCKLLSDATEIGRQHAIKNGDLFGHLKDPDDDKIMDEQMDAL